MQCLGCQHENPEHAKFCLECGGRLALTCAKCRAELPRSAKFCLECGAPIGPRSQARSPESYTPKHLAEKILTSKAALEGERKQVTVLFADLKGSMELLADRDPEEARKLLDPVLEHMMEAVHRYEGTVNQVMGDGIMALFGAPVAHEDHAIRACYAALRMQESVRRYAEGIFRSYGVPVEIRVGLNSGDVVVRAIGSDLHMDYTAVGQTTHLAARMEQMARAGTVLLTPETLRLAENFVQVSPRGPVAVKGLTAPIEIFALTGAAPVRSRLHAAAAKGLTRFVGRETEAALLGQALRQAGLGNGRVVAVVGEPGMGKSRLVWEVTHSPLSQDWLVLEAACVPYGKTVSYLPVAELLRNYFNIEAKDDPETVRAKVTAKLVSLDRVLEPALPVFLSLLDVPRDDEWAKLDPPRQRQQTLDAVKRLLMRESNTQPLLLVLEDLQWIDSETQALLDLLIDSVPAARVLLLVNYRPEYTHSWGHKTYYQQLRLDPLPNPSAGELLEALLGTGSDLTDLHRLLIEKTQGNPFFLEETVHSLVESKVLRGERGVYSLAARIEAVHIPPTVQSVLAARIDRLDPDEKRLLQAAAVIGKDVPFALLEAIADEPESSLRRGVSRLQAAEFLYESRLFPDLEYTFKHALTHEVAYGSLLEDRRRLLHGSIVAAMERLFPDRLLEHVERLAHHAIRAQEWESAVTYASRAAQKVYARSVASAAVAYYEQALNALGHMPQSRATIEQAIDLRLGIRYPLTQLADYSRVLEHLREAEKLAADLGDRYRLARVLTFLTFCHLHAVDHERSVECGTRAAAIAVEHGDAGLEATALFFLSQGQVARGDYHGAVPLYRRVIDLMASLAPTIRASIQSTPTALVFRPGVVRAWHAICLAELGRVGEAISVAQEGMISAEATDEPFARTVALFGLGRVLLLHGGPAPSLAVLEQGLALCRDSQIVLYEDHVLGALGYVYSLAGRVSEGLRLLEESVTLIRARKLRINLPQALCWRAEASLLAGRYAAALESGELALRAARDTQTRAVEAASLRILAAIAVHGETVEPETAEGYYYAALRLADELSLRPLAARCHRDLGILYRRMGKRDQVREHVTSATAMYRDMGMTYWLEEVEAEFN